MSLEKVTGIVLETRDIGEADSLVVVLLETGLKENFLLKGIRKSKRREIVAKEIANLISLVYYHKKNKEVFSIKEISVVNRFEQLKSSYYGFLITNAMIELVNKFIPKNLEQKKIFELLHQALHSLNELGTSPLSLPFFKLRLLQNLGYAPKDFECMYCSQNIFEKRQAFIRSTSFEINCVDCGSVPENHLDILYVMKKMTYVNYKTLITETISENLLNQLDLILNQFIHFQLGFELKSLALLSQLQKSF